MVVKVFKSKNDQLRRGDEVVTSQLSGSACLDELLIQKMLFSSPFLGKGSWKLVAPNKPISGSTIRGAFRQDLQSLGPEPSKFGCILYDLGSHYSSK